MMSKITLGMPEVLLFYSLYMYNISWGLSILTLALALLGRLASTLVEYGDKKQNGVEKKLD